MFTGIIEEVGSVTRVISQGISSQIIVAGHKVLEETKIGDSISINGVCLTVTHLTAEQFTADVMAETLRRTNLGNLRSGDKVNLERAMAANGRFGGHFVSGHIDGVGSITETRKEGNAIWITIQAPSNILELIIEKGSIAIDGISLTVAAVSQTDFKASIIPHTVKKTIFFTKGVGDRVNLENDLIGKYVQKFIKPKESETSNNGITMDFLLSNGF